MEDINIQTPAPLASPSLIFWRVSWPFFLFSVVLAAMFTLSWLFLLPRYTRVDVGGKAMTGIEIRDQKTALTAQIAQLESARRSLTLAVNDPHYETLKERRRSRKPMDAMTAIIEEHAKTLKNGTVHLRGFAYDPEKNMLTIRGDIRDAGVSSMTVLAQYVESLKKLSGVTAVTTPTFARMDDPAIGVHSPFAITLTFQ